MMGLIHSRLLVLSFFFFAVRLLRTEYSYLTLPTPHMQPHVTCFKRFRLQGLSHTPPEPHLKREKSKRHAALQCASLANHAQPFQSQPHTLRFRAGCRGKTALEGRGKGNKTRAGCNPRIFPFCFNGRCLLAERFGYVLTICSFFFLRTNLHLRLMHGRVS